MVSDRILEIDVFPRYSRLSKSDTVLMITRHFYMFASWIEKKESFHYNSRNNPSRFELLYRASRMHFMVNHCGIKDYTKIVGRYNTDVRNNSQGFKDTNSHGNVINIITPDVAFGAGLHCKLNADGIPTSFQVEEV
ncbi:1135_t:CDS:1 [Funneliformis geosporum]|uniref:5290_t:CDS:1 n=1 Tax=Funneliformis geosporum TaxID=1117311 RepID=A0A9W4SM63_9GLOM|nr:5290_t:CDS:1 [Funneliformis geosporum]CAI2188604.1 1135_t:CDS:1 [Funneliformis geosporum]